MSRSPSAARRQDLPGGVAGRVRDRLGRYRADLYRGRGPGISEAEWLRNTSLRPAVAGVPTAVSREELHLRTLRARGQHAEAAAEAGWAAAQFAAGASAAAPAAAGPAPMAGGAAPGWLARAAAWLAAGWLWARRRRARPGRGRTGR
jgi:hypothetical protein